MNILQELYIVQDQLLPEYREAAKCLFRQYNQRGEIGEFEYDLAEALVMIALNGGGHEHMPL